MVNPRLFYCLELIGYVIQDIEITNAINLYLRSNGAMLSSTE